MTADHAIAMAFSELIMTPLRVILQPVGMTPYVENRQLTFCLIRDSQFMRCRCPASGPSRWHGRQHTSLPWRRPPDNCTWLNLAELRLRTSGREALMSFGLPQ